MSKTQVGGEPYLTWTMEQAARKAETTARKARSERNQRPPENILAPLPAKWRFALDGKDAGVREKWFAPNFNDSGWKEIEIGRTWESQGYEYDGFAWYRVTFEVKPEWPADSPLGLHFGAVDGEAWVYWNGDMIGHHKGWDEPFSLPLRREQIKTDAPNHIAVRVWDGANQGGIYRPAHLVRLQAPRP